MAIEIPIRTARAPAKELEHLLQDDEQNLNKSAICKSQDPSNRNQAWVTFGSTITLSTRA